MLLKSMSPEQLFDSLWISTYANPHAKTKKTRLQQQQLKDQWMRRLTVSRVQRPAPVDRRAPWR